MVIKKKSNRYRQIFEGPWSVLSLNTYFVIPVKKKYITFHVSVFSEVAFD